MQLLNTDCGLDIFQGHLNLRTAGYLIQMEIDEPTRGHFSECSAMNWWLTFETHSEKQMILCLVAFRSNLLILL